MMIMIKKQKPSWYTTCQHWPNRFTHALSICGHFMLSALGALSRVWLFETLWTVARQAALSTGFFRQEYWSGLPSPPPRQLYEMSIIIISVYRCGKQGTDRLGCLPQITQLENKRASIWIQEVQGILWEHVCGIVLEVTVSKLGSIAGLWVTTCLLQNMDIDFPFL